MIKGCIFDLDGTLMNTLEDLGDSCNNALSHYHLKTHDYDAYKQFVGNGVYKLCERAVRPHVALLNDVYTLFQKEYLAHFLDKSKPYEGIVDLLEKLVERDIKVAVVTNKPHQFALALVQEKLPDIFVCVFGENINEYPKKPNPTSTFMAASKMGLDKDALIYIGDSNVDIETGHNAGLKSVGVSWGFRGSEELKAAGADAIIDTPSELLEIIDDWSK